MEVIIGILVTLLIILSFLFLWSLCVISARDDRDVAKAIYELNKKKKGKK